MSIAKKIRKTLGMMPVAPFDQTVARAIARVDAEFADLPFMKQDKAAIVANLIREHKLTRLLELGTFKGKSTAYLAALVDEMGCGHVTTIDRPVIEKHQPNVFEVLSQIGVERHVTVFMEPTSLTWRLMKMIEDSPRPQFDFCYLDAGHTWDTTGFSFYLVDQLLVPGGWVIFDDLNWTLGDNARRNGKLEQMRLKVPENEIEVQQVRKVWELLVKPHSGYIHHRETGNWGIAQKRPLSG